MTNINNLPTMAFHFFTAPNKVLITDDGYNNIVTAEIDENFDKDFVLDAKSFDILKKLKNPTIKINDNTITFKADNAKYKCNNIDKQPPALHLEDIIYECDYDINKLHAATKFVSNNTAKQVLCGVLFNDKGDVYATDSYKMYYASSGASSDCWWSVPVNFINLISTGHIAFTETKVIYKGDYDVYSSVYQGKIPDLSRALVVEGDEITFNNTNDFKLFESDTIEFKADNGSVLVVFNDNEKSFELELKTQGSLNNGFKISYKYFMDLLSVCGDEIRLTISQNAVKANDCVIVCGMR